MSQVPLRPSCCSLRGEPGILRGLRPRAHNTDRTGRDGTGHPPRPKRTATSGRGRGFVAHQEPALDSGVAPCRAAHTLARLDSAPSALSPGSENFASRCLVAWESRSPIVRERLSSGSANRKLREGQSGAGRGGGEDGRSAALRGGAGEVRRNRRFARHRKRTWSERLCREVPGGRTEGRRGGPRCLLCPPPAAGPRHAAGLRAEGSETEQKTLNAAVVAGRVGRWGQCGVVAVGEERFQLTPCVPRRKHACLKDAHETLVGNAD